MLNKIDVSIIIAAYNIENYIAKCIESVINQTFNNIEIIIINDGSTDSTKEILEEYKQKDKRIKIINQKNTGITLVRKRGYEEAKGEYLLFIDGDDWLEENCVEILYQNAKENKSDIVAYNYNTVFDNSIRKDRSFSEDIDKNEIIKEFLLLKFRCAIWSKLIKKEFLIQNKISFPESFNYGEDLAIIGSIIMHNPKVSFVEEHLYNYYQRDGSITKVFNEKVLEIQKAIQFIKDKDKAKNNILNKKYKLEFEYLCYMHIFYSKFLSCDFNNSLSEKLYNQYKSFVPNMTNKFIKKQIKTNNFFLKARIKLYLKSYKLGIFYDKLRNSFGRGQKSES